MQSGNSSRPSSYDVRDYGAVGDGVTLATAALQQAIDCCHAAGGGTVLVPSGIYLTGTLYLKSYVTLHLEAGATLLGSTRREDYNPDDVFPENPVFTSENTTGAHLIIAYRAEHVAITGEGTIDGNSAAFFKPLPPEKVTTTYLQKSCNFPIGDWRPGQMVYFCLCSHVRVRDVSLLNAPYWTLLLMGCTIVQIRGLYITNPPQTQNGDGIDIDCCRNVTVSDCLIRSGDDAITLRGNSGGLGDYAQACEHVTVTNCVLSSPCCGIRVGVGAGTIRNCRFSNIVMEEVRTGINFIAAYSDRWCGTAIEDIHMAHFTMNAVMPVKMLLGSSARPPACIRNVSLSHIRARGRQGSYIGGNEGMNVSDIRLHEVELELTGGDVDPQFLDKPMEGWGENHVPMGLYVRYLDHLRVAGLRVEWQEVSGGWRNAIAIENCGNVVLSGIEATPPPTETAGEMLYSSGVRGITLSTVSG